jgi:hypothetical protein
LAPITIAGIAVLIALAFNMLGIHLMKGLPAWQEWRASSYWDFFAWRAGLYCVVLWVWLRYRDHLFGDSTTAKTSRRRTEVSVVLSLLLIELIRSLLRQGV